MILNIVLLVIGLAIGWVSAWLVLRNNPRFLFRHYEHWLEKRMKDCIGKGDYVVRKKLREVKDRLEEIADDVT